MKDRLCSAIEALSLQEASDEDLANYESLTGSYLIEFDNGIICAFTSQYFYYSNGAQTEAPKLYRLLNSDDFGYDSVDLWRNSYNDSNQNITLKR